MKWRKVKKDFKKKKQRLTGLFISYQECNFGMAGYAVVEDVKITPAGGKRVNYEFIAKPRPIPDETMLMPDIDNEGFSLSYEIV